MQAPAPETVDLAGIAWTARAGVDLESDCQALESNCLVCEVSHVTALFGS